MQQFCWPHSYIIAARRAQSNLVAVLSSEYILVITKCSCFVGLRVTYLRPAGHSPILKLCLPRSTYLPPAGHRRIQQFCWTQLQYIYLLLAGHSIISQVCWPQSRVIYLPPAGHSRIQQVCYPQSRYILAARRAQQNVVVLLASELHNCGPQGIVEFSSCDEFPTCIQRYQGYKQ